MRGARGLSFNVSKLVQRSGDSDMYILQSSEVILPHSKHPLLVVKICWPPEHHDSRWYHQHQISSKWLRICPHMFAGFCTHIFAFIKGKLTCFSVLYSLHHWHLFPDEPISTFWLSVRLVQNAWAASLVFGSQAIGDARVVYTTSSCTYQISQTALLREILCAANFRLWYRLLRSIHSWKDHCHPRVSGRWDCFCGKRSHGMLDHLMSLYNGFRLHLGWPSCTSAISYRSYQLN